KNNAASAFAGAAEVKGTIPGVLGGYQNGVSVRPTAQNDQFMFFVDEVELDLAKSFGENIRLRADLDFGSTALNSGRRFEPARTNNAGGLGAIGGDAIGVDLEQAYATTNLAIGNGVEMLMGRFNAPMGFEANDTNENDTISKSVLARALRPNSFTGVKFFYAFSDMVDFHLYASNGGLTHDSYTDFGQAGDIPTGGFRLGFNWGDEGSENVFGLSGAIGRDHVTASKRGRTFLGDVDFNIWATDSFAIGGEALYRQIDTVTAAPTAGHKNGKYLGGLVNFHYDISDVWDGTLRYSYAQNYTTGGVGNGVPDSYGNVSAEQSLFGAVNGKGKMHEAALAANYAISDGATFRVEGNWTYVNPKAAGANEKFYGVAGALSYAF
ncbi:MAG: outer membrane beta-barrel protein, partial [Deltaproteobacteria bacterium]|nr:outer membrane beta-barrel protein [Deltaproteobacteria bacterium]